MIEIRADQQTFDAVARALAEESTGTQFRRNLTDEIYHDLEPAVGEVRGRLLAGGGNAGAPHGEPLLPAIAAGVHADVRVSGKAAGARIRASKTGVRGFANAPKRFNEKQFRHRVFGRNTWVTQVGVPGWFDDTLSHDQGKYQRAVLRAIENRIRRITRKA